ncbi:MAG: MetQ/NlpA family ABC transporter substrate-binding protein [Treponemataceae bacterium]
MKKILIIVMIFFVAGLCFAGGVKDTDPTVLRVGASPTPHAEMLNLIKASLAEKGFTLEVMEFTDYVTPNEALQSGQILANFFQHLPYMETFNKDRNFSLASAGGIHIEPIALYSKKIKSLGALNNGSTIAIPNDPTNEGRALLLLQSAGLIKLNAKAGITATPLDIVENIKNLKFREIEAASLPRVLADVDAAVINGNYAIPAGLSAKKNGLFVEGSDSPYVNIVSVKKGNESDPRIVALIQALKSDVVRQYIDKKYSNGEVVIVQ